MKGALDKLIRRAEARSFETPFGGDAALILDLVSALKKNGPAEAATSPSHGSQSPNGKSNMDRNTIDALQLAMGTLDTAENYIHAAWMAARSMDGDERPAGEAIQAVIALAGDTLGQVRSALRKAGVA